MERHVNIVMINNNHFSYARMPEEPRARAVTGRRCPHSRVGEDFFARWLGFFYENGSNSEKKSQKIDPKVANEQSLRGLQTDH